MAVTIDIEVDEAKTDAKTEQEAPANGGANGATNGAGSAKNRFAKAVEEAVAGVQALRDEAVSRTDTYREKLVGKSNDLNAQAKTLSEQTLQKASALANDGKARTSGALTSLGKLVADNAPVLDEKLGPQFGDYARATAQQLHGTAARIDAKDLSELGEDARKFIRTNPGAAVGIAAVAGFMLARLFRRSED